MALDAATVWEIEFGGSDTNGGGFVTGASGTDWSMQLSPQYSVADGVTAGTTTITSATAAFGTDVVGNIMSVTGGTGAVVQNWYRIVSRTNATTIVVDRSTGLTAGTGVTLKIGGALATPGGLGAVLALVAVAGMRAWMKYNASAYAMTIATNNVSGGVFTMAAVSFNFEGYEVTRGDRTANRPQTSWASVASPGSPIYIFSTTGTGRQRFANLAANGNSVNNVGGFSLTGGARVSAIQCVALNCNGTAGVGFLGILSNIGAKSCQANTCTIGFSLGTCTYCWATACGIGFSGPAFMFKCLANLCTTSGFGALPSGSLCVCCTSDNNTTNGFIVTGTGSAFLNCIASNQSGGGGVGFSIGTNLASLDNCASYNNLTEVSAAGPLINEGMILNASFTGGQPYTAAGSDFRPNNTAGAGALIRNAGIGVYGQTDNVDIGAVQHTDPAGGSGGVSLAGRGGGIAG